MFVLLDALLRGLMTDNLKSASYGSALYQFIHVKAY